MRAFITGSRAYGKPTKTSDIDLVVFTDVPTAVTLAKLADGSPKDDQPIRYGRLNLVLVTDDKSWAAWFMATECMKNSGERYTKEEAAAVIDQYYDEIGGQRGQFMVSG